MIRLGNATAEFVEQFRNEAYDQIDNVTNSHNVILRGDISMTRAFNGLGDFIGSSSYEINGYKNDRRLVEFPNGDPSVILGSKLVAERVMMIESTTMSDTGAVFDDDVRLQRGSLTHTGTSPPPYGVTIQGYKFDGYHVRRISDYDAWTSQLFVDGKVNITWNPFFGSGCMNGPYSFRTRAPLVNSLSSDVVDSGDVVVNGSVRARFYLPTTVPRTLPAPVNGMLVSVRVADLGTFNYDAASAREALMPVGGCQL